jgi:hypothetical protein
VPARVEEDTRGLRSVRGGDLRVPLVCCHTSADLSQQHDLDVFQQVPRHLSCQFKAA